MTVCADHMFCVCLQLGKSEQPKKSFLVRFAVLLTSILWHSGHVFLSLATYCHISLALIRILDNAFSVLLTRFSTLTGLSFFRSYNVTRIASVPVSRVLFVFLSMEE